MRRVQSIAELRAAVAEARGRGQRIGFVPTMGYLHEGHLSLVEQARKKCDFTVMSIFVNPLQFGPSEDLAAYPRDFEHDATLAQSRGVDLVFHPDPHEMYPAGPPYVTVTAGGLSDHLCGIYRPGHFEGVLTVVAKLFNLVQPDVAVFGQKDFQQVVVVRGMVRDLNFPIDIEAAPIVREADGLAMSSRNIYLDSQQRRDALALQRGLQAALRAYEQGERNAIRLLDLLRAEINSTEGVVLQYANLVDPDTLTDRGEARPGDVLAVAAFVGRTRLIDNQILP